MILADKLIKLRKKFGFSQEELAEKMNVSRQSVSKWESAASIPDLNKIIKLADIFGVSTDYLLRDDMEEPDHLKEDTDQAIIQISLEEANDYVEKKQTTGKKVAKGVLLCIYAVTPLIFLLALSEGEGILPENIAIIIGLTTLLVTVAFAVSIFIRSNQYESLFNSFEREAFELAYGVESVYRQKIDYYRSTYHRRVSLSVVMYILSVIPLVTVALLEASETIILLMVVVLLLIAGLSTYLLIPVATLYGAYQCLLGEGEYSIEAKESVDREERLAAFYWPLITAIYIGWSFVTMDWGTTWIVWPVAGIFYVALIGFINLLSKDKSGHSSN